MEDIKNKIQLFEDFQEKWNLERISNMKIEEYTSIQKDNPNRDDFTYWLESKMDVLGSIWGGSAFKFGIYKRSDTSKKETQNGRTYNENYAWLTRYGKNETEAFYNVKDKIIQIIKASQNNRLEDIEKIDFGDAVKWKIAFHYQDIKNIKIINIFSKDVLNLIASSEIKEKLKIYQIHERLLKDKNLSLGEMIEQISIPLWVKYGEGSQIYLEKMKELFCKYLKSNRKLNQDDIDKYNQTINEISSLYLKKSLYQCTKFEFSKNLEELKKNQYFMAKYNDKNGIYLKTLECYEEFLRNHFEEEIMEIKMQNVNLPLNQILYGPPGTGKTYHTIDKALDILGENLENRDDKKAKFDEYINNGQIVFITFHQSYGYEEFVEGIKPVMGSEQSSSKEVEYEIKDGVFKELCKRALDKEREIAVNIENIISKNPKVWKISLGAKEEKETGSLQTYCFENNQIRIGWGDTRNKNNPSINNFGSMQIGDLVCVLDTERTIKAVGVIKSKVKYSKEEENKKGCSFDIDRYQTYREVEWILKNKVIDIYELNNNDNTKLDQKTVYELKNILVGDLIEIIKDNLRKKFIIIIDEINRGNVSKIFGELITLIEPSKRIGESEELKVILPYSGEKFGVPKNVYIIGTMNTADRSITSLDTALRRRFEFVEMMPKPSKLFTIEDINLQELLKAINTRIEYLLDREKTIGHAFFIGVKNLEDLKSVFQNKIIPLLQEYFYNDYALINAVLNKNGMLKKQDTNNDYLKNMTEFIENDKVIYEFSDSKKWDETTFRKIYE